MSLFTIFKKDSESSISQKEREMVQPVKVGAMPKVKTKIVSANLKKHKMLVTLF